MKPSKRYVLDIPETVETERFFGTMARFAQEFEKKGMTYYMILGADLPQFGYTSKSLQRYLSEAAQEGWFFYPDPLHGMLIDAILSFEKKFSNLGFSAEDIILTPGCGGGWSLIHNVLLEPGDEIVTIVPCHYLSMMGRVARYLGAKIITSPCIEEEDWAVDIDALRKKITNKTKFIELDHPNNPTGVIYSEKERKTIIDIAGEYDIPVISDEMYEYITYDGKEAPSMAKLTNDVPIICMRSFSKMFMSPGARFGWISFHDPQGSITEFKNACKNPANSFMSSGAIPCPIIVAATRGLKACVDMPKYVADKISVKNPMSELNDMRRELQEHRDYIYKRVTEIEGLSMVKPVATLYGIPKVEGIGKIWKTDEDFLFGLMKEEQVALNKGARFGAPEHFRMMLMPRIPELKDIFDRIERFIIRHSK